MQFLKIAPDARSTGMAETFSAVTNDVSALYWNPAGITRIDSQQFHFQAGFTRYYAATNLQYGGAVYRVAADKYLGLHLIFLSSGNMDVTTEFMPFGTGQTYQASDLAIGLTYAQNLTQNFGFGLTTKYIRESIFDVNTSTVVFDFGFQYEVGKANTRFAVGISNFGFNAEPKGEVSVTTLTGTTNVSDFEGISIPAIFRLGVAWDAVKKESHLFTLAAQLNHPTDNNETYSLGSEYGWKNTVFLRTGYLFGVDEKGAPSFGFGVNYKRSFGMVKLDYGFANKWRLGMTHRITLGLSLFK